MRLSSLSVLAFGLISSTVAQSIATPVGSITPSGPTATPTSLTNTVAGSIPATTPSTNSSASVTSSGTPTSASSGVASACSSQIASVPTCAMEPLASAAAIIGCAVDDYYCWCDNAETLQSVAATGVIDVCGSQANDVIVAAQAVCQCVASSGADCPSSSAGGAGSASSNSSATVSSASSAAGNGTVLPSTTAGNVTALPSTTAPSNATFSATSTAPAFTIPNETGGVCTCACACGDGPAPTSTSPASSFPASVGSSSNKKRALIQEKAERQARQMASDLAAKKKALRSINTSKLQWPKLQKRQDSCPAASSFTLDLTSTSPAAGATASTSDFSGGAAGNFLATTSRFSFEGMITAVLALFLAI